MPGEIPPNGEAAKLQQNLLKMQNLDKQIDEGLDSPVAETVNFENDSVCSKEPWNWVHNVRQQCQYDSSEERGQQQSLDILEAQIQCTDQNKIKSIHGHHNSPAAGHQGRAKTYELLRWSYTWGGMRNAMD